MTKPAATSLPTQPQFARLELASHPSPTPEIAPLSFFTTASAIPVSENPPRRLHDAGEQHGDQKHEADVLDRSLPARVRQRLRESGVRASHELVPHREPPNRSPPRLPRSPAPRPVWRGSASLRRIV